MSKRSGSGRRAAPRQGGAGGYLAAVLASAIVTCVLLAALVLLLRPDALDSLAVAEAITPAPADADVTPASAPPSARAVVASGQSVNVRSGPGTAFDAVSAAAPGAEVLVLGQDDSGRWYNVRLPDGAEGWIAAELLTLDTGAPPADTAATPAAPAEATPEAVACAPGEVQDWWDETASQPYYQMVFALDQFPQSLAAEDYQRIYDTVRAARASFDAGSHPACVEDQRAGLLAAFDEVILAVREIANNNAQSANSRAAAARRDFQTALAALETGHNADVAITNCGAEVWSAGIKPELDALFTNLGSVDLNTSAPDDVRRALFEMQRIRRYLGKLAAPGCVRVASEALLGALDNYAAMYQAALSSDRTTASNRLAAATSQFNVFQAEMRKLGLG